MRVGSFFPQPPTLYSLATEVLSMHAKGMKTFDMYRKCWRFGEIMFLSRREENKKVKIGSRLVIDVSLAHEHVSV